MMGQELIILGIAFLLISVFLIRRTKQRKR